MRADIDLPVVAVTVVLAAVVQDMLPVTELLPVKIGFLTAVALFYIITRPFVKALVVVIWAGMLTDALGGLPILCTIGFLLVAYGIIHFLRSMIYRANILTGIVLCAGFSCVQMIWTQIWAGTSGGGDIWYRFALFGYSMIAGVIAGGTGFAVCLMVDNLSGCSEPAKEKNGLSWTKAD
jgi:hypothetical protein